MCERPGGLGVAEQSVGCKALEEESLSEVGAGEAQLAIFSPTPTPGRATPGPTQEGTEKAAGRGCKAPPPET